RYGGMGESRRAWFRRLSLAAAVLYPAVGLALLPLGMTVAVAALWPLAATFVTAGLVILSLVFLSYFAGFRVLEIVNHFLYRIQSERRQDDGRSMLDWRSRLGGNIGIQIRRMMLQESRRKRAMP